MQNETREKWNRAAEDFQRTVIKETDGGYAQRVTDFLEARGELSPAARVADIGCGAGKYAIKFSARGLALLLIDISDKMLDFTRGNLAASGADFSRIEIAECDFAAEDIEKRGWEKCVDLAFASMSPASTTADGVLKMSRMSRGGCFIATYACMENRLFGQLCAAVGVENPGRRDFDYLEPARYARQLGYLPEVIISEHGWVNELPPEELAPKFFAGRMTDLPDTAENREKALEKMRALADERGLVREEVSAKAAWIYWRVD